MMKYIIMSAAAVILMSGCSTKSNFYQLHVPQTQETKHTAILHSRVIGVDQVGLADYLDKPQIVTRLSSGRLSLHEEDRWAGALDKNIQSILTQNFSKSLPNYTFLPSPWDEPVEDRYRIYVDIDRFDGDMNGTVTLDARWSLVDKKENRLLTGEKIHDVERGLPTLDGIVATQSHMIERLSHKIVKKIRGYI
jgi:uncharacterized lipoprotein YmbA